MLAYVRDFFTSIGQNETKKNMNNHDEMNIQINAAYPFAKENEGRYLKIYVKTEHSQPVIYLSGWLDYRTQRSLRDFFEKKFEEIRPSQREVSVYFDLVNLEYLDSTALGALLLIYRGYAKINKNFKFKVLNSNKKIQSILEDTHFERFFEFV